jgi:isopenicillin-N N-acyltransferase like protein
VIRGALRYAKRDAALAFLQSVSHASGQHYGVGSPDGVVSIECSANATVLSSAGSGEPLIHTNYPLANEDVDPIAEAELEQRGSVADSKRRLEILHAQSASIRQASSG